MPNLLFQFAAAFAVGQGLRDGRLRSVLYAGVCLPEILHQGFLLLAGTSAWFCLPLHSPLGMVPWCYLGALLFEAGWRPRAFGALLAGSWIHLLVEGIHDSWGEGGVLWAFPVTLARFGGRILRDDPSWRATLGAAALIAGLSVASRLGKHPRGSR
ncbi:MAG TPA: hypothetical protein VEN81_03870 [Planctomycetota bacterium]|nr:hypothetical protein [Planctomycetota bacterium]